MFTCVVDELRVLLLLHDIGQGEHGKCLEKLVLLSDEGDDHLKQRHRYLMSQLVSWLVL